MSSLMSFTGNLGVTHGGIFIAHSHGIVVCPWGKLFDLNHHTQLLAR
jgi:hypothetical protein